MDGQTRCDTQNPGAGRTWALAPPDSPNSACSAAPLSTCACACRELRDNTAPGQSTHARFPRCGFRQAMPGFITSTTSRVASLCGRTCCGGGAQAVIVHAHTSSPLAQARSPPRVPACHVAKSLDFAVALPKSSNIWYVHGELCPQNISAEQRS